MPEDLATFTEKRNAARSFQALWRGFSSAREHKELFDQMRSRQASREYDEFRLRALLGGAKAGATSNPDPPTYKYLQPHLGHGAAELAALAEKIPRVVQQPALGPYVATAMRAVLEMVETQQASMVSTGGRLRVRAFVGAERSSAEPEGVACPLSTTYCEPTVSHPPPSHRPPPAAHHPGRDGGQAGGRRGAHPGDGGL